MSATWLPPYLLTSSTHIQPITIAPSTHLCHVAESIEGFSFRPISGGETACPPRFVLGSPFGGQKGEHELRKGVHLLEWGTERSREGWAQLPPYQDDIYVMGSRPNLIASPQFKYSQRAFFLQFCLQILIQKYQSRMVSSWNNIIILYPTE